MADILYVQLLNEGTTVYRPVPATHVSEGVYVLGGTDNYDPESEEWAFLPGVRVKAAIRTLNGKQVLVAFEQA